MLSTQPIYDNLQLPAPMNTTTHPSAKLQSVAHFFDAKFLYNVSQLFFNDFRSEKNTTDEEFTFYQDKHSDKTSSSSMNLTEDQLESSAKFSDDVTTTTTALRPSMSTVSGTVTLNGSTWNKVLMFPAELPKPIQNKPHQCRFCKAAFRTGNSLGGHMRKRHPG